MDPRRGGDLQPAGAAAVSALLGDHVLLRAGRESSRTLGITTHPEAERVRRPVCHSVMRLALVK